MPYLSPEEQGPAISVRRLKAGYGDRVIINDVSFDVPHGEIVCLIGGSGCGKSTVVRTLVGLLTPMEGEVRVFGKDPSTLEGADRIALLRRTGMLFQNGDLLGSMTVGDNVTLPLREHTDLPDAIIARIVATKLAMVDLPDAANLTPAELSGGMRKRASLSRAIAMDPELLFCDEPSAGLDPIVAAGLDVTLRRLQKRLGMTMIVVTHELASIQLIADRVVMLTQGGYVLAQGTLAEMNESEHPEVREFFGRKPPDEEDPGRSLLQVLEEG
ncbi:MAG: ATP-binding cassette domain-containing protein [Deltaproteobacteria bacterium]|nr:ATP-binding cassette domain-containing protein [Deltaproteobacteria bacterium]